MVGRLEERSRVRMKKEAKYKEQKGRVEKQICEVEGEVRRGRTGE